MEQLRAAQRRRASRSRHQQHSSDQRSRRLASYGHHGAARVADRAAAQALSAVTEATVRAASRHGPAARAICGAALYSAPEIGALVTAAERVCELGSRKSHALSSVRPKQAPVSN